MFIDLDHFKQVNDTHGHLVGSRLLAEMGEALKTNCRLIDFAFRYGGDEFVILLAADLEGKRDSGCATPAQTDSRIGLADGGRPEYQGYAQRGSGGIPGRFED